MPKLKTSTDPKIKYLPFVSVVTVTFNRRPFWETALQLFRDQTYPKNRMEWIILDDGTDKIADLVYASKIAQIKYIPLDTKLSLGAKRNLSHTYCKGSIIVYNDDDDYYPPERVAHAVETLESHPEALCAGSSELYIYFKHVASMYQCGPYSPTHATAGTFAFRRELLSQTRYDDDAALAEEKNFLKGYTIPFVQLDPLKTILVFSHEHNTFDKRKLLEGPVNSQYLKPSDKKVSTFVRGRSAPAMTRFFMDEVDARLAQYEPGEPKHKPDALAQIKRIEAERAELMRVSAAGVAPIVLQIPGQGARTLTQDEVVAILKDQAQALDAMQQRAAAADVVIAALRAQLAALGVRPVTETECFGETKKPVIEYM